MVTNGPIGTTIRGEYADGRSKCRRTTENAAVVGPGRSGCRSVGPTPLAEGQRRHTLMSLPLYRRKEKRPGESRRHRGEHVDEVCTRVGGSARGVKAWSWGDVACCAHP